MSEINEILLMDRVDLWGKGYDNESILCTVTYADSSKQDFTVKRWVQFRNRIIPNLIEKGLASVEVVEPGKTEEVKVSQGYTDQYEEVKAYCLLNGYAVIHPVNESEDSINFAMVAMVQQIPEKEWHRFSFLKEQYPEQDFEKG